MNSGKCVLDVLAKNVPYKSTIKLIVFIPSSSLFKLPFLQSQQGQQSRNEENSYRFGKNLMFTTGSLNERLGGKKLWLMLIFIAN